MPAQSHVLYANSKKQSLAHHNAMVGLVAQKLIQDTYKSKQAWSQAALLAGMLHDIGKADANFQTWILSSEAPDIETQDGSHMPESKATKGFSFNDYPRHNEVSWALIASYFDETPLKRIFLQGNSHLWECVKHSVFWHHAKPIREDMTAFRNRSEIMKPLEGGKVLRDTVLSSLLADTFTLAGVTFKEEALLADSVEREESIPDFKKAFGEIDATNSTSVRGAVTYEAMRSAVRSAVVSADRLVSALSAEELAQWLELYAENGSLPLPRETAAAETADNALVHAQIQAMLEAFERDYGASSRNAEQSAAAAALSTNQVAVLQGPAGCGKTKIMLEYIAQQPEGMRTFIFVPRTAIGQELFRELVNEYGVNASVELLTSDLRQIARNKSVSTTTPAEELTAQIVITTIDQLCAIALSHRRIDLLTEIMRSTMIVDEFHELFDIPAIVLMFLETMSLRFCTEKGGTLLVSATPNPFFLDRISELDTRSSAPLTACVTTVPSFNLEPLFVEFDSYDPKAGPHPFDGIRTPGDIAVSNTATRAQRSAFAALDAEASVLCFHSKFTPDDKKYVLAEVMNCFGKRSFHEERILFSGPIVQASLNITCRTLHTEATHAENWLQRLGRVNRFASFGQGTLKVYDCIEKGTAGKADKALLSRLSQHNRTQAWISFCYERALNRKTTLKELYEAYAEFHQTALAKTAYELDYLKLISTSAKVFKDKVFDPIQYPVSSSKKGKKLSANSLRGNSYFVLPAFCEYSAGKLVTKRWLFTDASPDGAVLTDSLTAISHLSESDKAEYLNYMSNKDIDVVKAKVELPADLRKKFSTKGRGKASVKSVKQWTYLARSRGTPVVLSFTGRPQAALEFEQFYIKKNGVLLGLMKTIIQP